MKATTTVFAQMIKLLPRQLLEEIAGKYFKPGNATKFTIWDQLVALIFCHTTVQIEMWYGNGGTERPRSPLGAIWNGVKNNGEKGAEVVRT